MAKLSPIGNSQVVDSAGDPASGWKWYTYVAGSSTPQTTYTSEDSSTAQANPVVLDSSGRPSSPIWLTEGASYKFVLTNSLDVVQATFDNIDGINDASLTVDQWAASGLTPNYVSGTSFTVVGDQTSDLHVNRRIKITDGAGTKYGYIATSTFTTLTTVTVTLDSGTLTSPLSALSLGIQTSDNPSEPLLTDAYPLRSGSSDKTKKVRLEVDGLTTGTTRVITVPDADITLNAPASDTLAGVIELAVQSEMETGTDVARAVTPGRQQFHPSAAKAWVQYNSSGTIAGSYNVTSVTDNGTGDVTVNFTTAFSANTYAIAGLVRDGAVSFPYLSGSTASGPAVGSCRVVNCNGANSALDALLSTVVCYGDQL